MVAILLSENPSHELLSASIEEFGLDDLIDVASDIAMVELHHPPIDMLRFHQVKLYVSSDVSIGTTYYPQDVQFAANRVIFGTNASIDYELGDTMQAKAKVDKFWLGPLDVSGSGPEPQGIAASKSIRWPNISSSTDLSIFCTCAVWLSMSRCNSSQTPGSDSVWSSISTKAFDSCSTWRWKGMSILRAPTISTSLCSRFSSKMY